MATPEQRNHAWSSLNKAEEYLASADANLTAKRRAPAAGDAIHAGVSAKDAIVTVLTGSTSKERDRERGEGVPANTREATGSGQYRAGPA